ncbi:MAG: hypothetical protein J1E29_06875 [Duncaniella sp.]|nr:hypothetical protein [Duncaniella sp.]
MYNVPIKILFPAVVALMLVSCGGNSSQQQAQAVVNQATDALNSGDFNRALLLADSVKTAWPEAIDARREALHISVRATEGLTLRKLESTDSLLTALSVTADSLKNFVKLVSNPVENYYIAAGDNPGDVYASSGLRARLSLEGDFYLIATLRPGGVKATSVMVSDGAATAATATVAYDGERNDRSDGMERITFIAAECDSVGRFIFEHAGVPLKLTFSGSSTKSVTLTPESAKRIAVLYDYASTLRRARVASVERERLSRALDMARAQAARTYVVKDSVID